MTEDEAKAPGPEGTGASNPETTQTGAGFSPIEKTIGAVAGYKAPLLSSVAASYLLRSETDPARRDELVRFRRASLIWGGVGILVAIVVLIIALAAISSHGGGSACRGGIDRFAGMNTTYQSTDNKHWTATYPCNGGGETTVPIARRLVPGEGR